METIILDDLLEKCYPNLFTIYDDKVQEIEKYLMYSSEVSYFTIDPWKEGRDITTKSH